jgi:hypothetical protein
MSALEDGQTEALIVAAKPLQELAKTLWGLGISVVPEHENVGRRRNDEKFAFDVTAKCGVPQRVKQDQAGFEMTAAAELEGTVTEREKLEFGVDPVGQIPEGTRMNRVGIKLSVGQLIGGHELKVIALVDRIGAGESGKARTKKGRVVVLSRGHKERDG